MGGRGSGRIARPAKLKLVNGRSPGRDSGGRKVDPGPRFGRQAPEPPDDLTPNERAMWQRVVDDLEPLNLLKDSDFGVLRLYVDAWSQYHAAKRLVDASLLVKTPKTGVVRRNPAVSIMAELRRDLVRIGGELGLSPVSEQRLREQPTPGGDDMGYNPFAG